MFKGIDGESPQNPNEGYHSREISPKTEIWIDNRHSNHPTFGGKDWENLAAMLEDPAQRPAWFWGLGAGAAPQRIYPASSAEDRGVYYKA